MSGSPKEHNPEERVELAKSIVVAKTMGADRSFLDRWLFLSRRSERS